MEEQNLIDKLARIKSWLGTGSLDVFGLPMSGKDTVGERLAKDLDAKFLSSGIIIPTNTFYDIILPYFSREEMKNDSLILSSVGRWAGEEDKIMEAAKNGGHEIKAVVLLDLTETDVKNRFEAAKELNDRGGRADDASIEIFETRIREFNEKTIPVLNHYDELKLLIRVPADGSRDEVYSSVIDKLVEFINQ